MNLIILNLQKKLFVKRTVEKNIAIFFKYPYTDYIVFYRSCLLQRSLLLYCCILLIQKPTNGKPLEVIKRPLN